MSSSINQDQLQAVLGLVREAGATILSIRDSGEMTSSNKDGGSIVTSADLASNTILMNGLGEVLDIPIVSEEIEESYPEGDYWLIDPLDGTSDFAKGRDSYAVMVALMRDQQPVFGVVYAPSKDEMFYGGELIGGAYLESDGKTDQISVAKAPHQPLRIVASRSHRHPDTDAFLDQLDKPYEILSIGSGLKFCYVANGTLDVYVRYQGTMEWDTAAPEAIVSAAGAEIMWQDSGFVYGKKGRLNRGFICKPQSLNLNV